MNKKDIFLDYKSLIKSSLIDVIKHALKKTSEYGISNGHHFYITFDTTDSRNQIPEYLKKDYPKTMMIVIENEYWNLKVEQEYFSVDLKFKGKIDNLKNLKKNKRNNIQVLYVAACKNLKPGKIHKSNASYVLKNLDFALTIGPAQV